jgi:MoaA/NifB/PqqE/SkfB family radical SAM enzyme
VRSVLDTLVLMPSWHCDIACAHCLFSSSPKLHARLELDLARGAIADAARTTSARRVVVSGGEPFADFDYLLALARATQSAGLELGVVTNGSFAADPARARAMLEQLQAAGLRGLTVSWDHFHAAFVDPAHIRALLKLCRQLQLSVLVSAITTRSHSLGDALAALGDDGFEVPAIQFRCLPVGRAARKVPHEDLPEVPERDRHRACSADFASIAVTADGSVFPCSAVGGFSAGLCLGNIRDEALPALLQKRERELRWTLLASRGPRAFLAHASVEEMAQLGIAEEDHDCVACHRLFSSPLADGIVARARTALHAQVEASFDLATLGSQRSLGQSSVFGPR